MKILAKFPTRERPNQFSKVLNTYREYAENLDNIEFLVTIDADDTTMNSVIPSIEELVTLDIGFSTGKINAVNRGMEKAVSDWDILILISDDMIPQVEGWDKVIVDSMKDNFPDTDGVLFYSDGYSDLNTMCIMGRKYYERFNYIYHPDYISLFCDNEFMEVADQLHKQTHFPNTVLFKHEHFANNKGIKRDLLYQMNEKFYGVDQETYSLRKANNFDLIDEALDTNS